MPHAGRVQPPFYTDVLEQLDEVLSQVRNNDCVIIMGDLNCKLARNIPNRTGRWSIHTHSNAVGEEMLELMNRRDLSAVSTMFKPPRGKTNATFVPRDPAYKDTQIDFILVSSRWATSVNDSKVKWGPSFMRWGRKYDHGLVNCLFASRLRTSKRPKHLDYSSLKDSETRQHFEERVKASLSRETFNEEDVSASLKNLRDTLTNAAAATLPVRKPMSLRKRSVSQRTKQLYHERAKCYDRMTTEERKTANRALHDSCRNDYRDYISNIVRDIEVAERVGNIRKVSNLVNKLAKQSSSHVMPSKDHDGKPITSSDQLLKSWNTFLEQKFATPECDQRRHAEATVPEHDLLTDKELDEALFAMKPGRAAGWDGIPAELYQNSETARRELYRIMRLIWNSEVIPPELVKGIFIMFYKKKDRNCFSNYRAICLLCHAYKLLSSVIAKRLHIDLEKALPDSQAGFRPARGTRDNVCILKWTIKMLLRESRKAVVTFIDYSAAFDTESHIFLDEALSKAGASVKVRRIIQNIFRVAQGCVRTSNADGTFSFSDVFDINRGVLQGDIFSPIAFIIGLWHIFMKYDNPDAGITVGVEPHTVHVSNLEYADDASLVDPNVAYSSDRLSGISTGSSEDAAMSISIDKTKCMHIHSREKVSATTEAEVIALKLPYKCDKCGRTFTTDRGRKVHKARWCDGRRNRSRAGTLSDKAVQLAKRKAIEAARQQVVINGEPIDNVYSFVYLGSHVQCDGDDEADVKHRMDIAQAIFSKLWHIWTDHRLPVALKLRLYCAGICSTFTHACEAWCLTSEVIRKINGFNSRCLHAITRKSYRETATNPAFNLVRAVRQRRLRFLGHILRLPPDRLLRQTLFAYVMGEDSVPVGSLVDDYPGFTTMEELVQLANNRAEWADMVKNI